MWPFLCGFVIGLGGVDDGCLLARCSLDSDGGTDAD